MRQTLAHLDRTNHVRGKWRSKHKLDAHGKWIGKVVMKNTRGRAKASTLTEKLAMKELLDLHLIRVEGTDFFHYEPNWNDNRIATEVNPLLTTFHAKYVRIQMFGQIQKKGRPKGGKKPLLKARMDLWETRFSKLLGVLKLTPAELLIVMGQEDPEDAVSTDTPEGATDD